MANKKREFEPFSVSFLDCICCGFGAVILLFVLTSGKKSEYRKTELAEVDIDLGSLTKTITQETEETKKTQSEIQKIKDAQSDEDKKKAHLETTLKDKKESLKTLLKELVELTKSEEKLLAEKEKMATTIEKIPVPKPNPVKRQYLTDFKTDGEHVLILIEASGGMLDITTEDAIRRTGSSPETKRQAPKWRRSVKAAEWMISTLRPPTKIQIITFNKEAPSIIPTRPDEWIELSDSTTVFQALDNLRKVVPKGGANHERAFWRAKQLKPIPDNIILITDGLPTLGDSIRQTQIVDPKTRKEMFIAAKNQLPIAVPVNIIMFPMSGDPDAAALFWKLACQTNGSFICPAQSWPSI